MSSTGQRGRRAVEALISPLRVEIVEHLQAGGPSSVARLAQALHRTPQSLHYHVALLTKAGVLVEHERRKAQRHHEAIYALASERIALAAAPRAAHEQDALVRSASAILRRAERNFRRAVEGGLLSSAPPKLGAVLGTRKVRLSQAGFRRVQRAIERIERELGAEAARGDAHTFLWTVALAPLAAREHGRTR